MTLPVGSMLGPYEILAPLGAGGMGEVYRAWDPRLHRELAIKVLPESIAKDPERLARFQSEARSASALSHPNIITIHGIGSDDGLSYILMELVDGKTVRQLLDGGPPPLKKTLQIAIQAAEGLAAAHASGIVHRDLKPENLMVSRDGVVKILDFGLAKTTPLYARPGEETASYQGVATQAGSVLGTVGYMSPEQAAGRSLDFRSDQFSFGTILHEMLTGKRTWRRNSAAETLTAIIREDPQSPIAAGAPRTPTALRWIVDRCLAKDPEERYASTRDLVRDLITLRDRLSEAGASDFRAGPHGEPGPRSRRRRTIAIVAVFALALGAGIVLAPRLRNSPLPNWVQVGFRRGIVWSARFAPDGQTIVYSAGWDGEPPKLFSTRPAWTETRTLDLPSGELLTISRTSELAFVRNANFAKFFTQPGTLVSAGLEGGIGRDLLDNVQAADWSPDGSQLAVAREVNGKVSLEYPIGKTLYETARPISNVRLSRDGRWIAFLEGGSDVSLSVLRVSDGLKRTLSTGWFPSAVGLAWSADGREIWFTPQKQVRDSSPPLLAVSLSGKLREVFRAPGQMHLFDIAPDGRALLARWDVQVGVRGFAPPARRDRELSATDDSLLADLSSDGTAVLFQDRKALFLRRTDGSPPLRLGQRFREARFSPDAQWALALPPEEPSHPVLIPIGAGEVRRIETQSCDGVEWFPDGQRILCEQGDQAGITALTALELPSGRATPIPIPATASDQIHAGPISPDGGSLAGADRAGNVWILPLAGGQLRRFAGAGGLGRGALPAGWAADGQHIFIHHAGEIPDRVQKLDLATGRVEPWTELTMDDLAGVVRISPVRVAANGRSWAYSYLRVFSNLYVVEGLK